MTDAERRRDALKWLAVARQADVDPSAAVVYQQALADLSAEDVEAACRALGNEPRDAFESAMPSVGTIRTRASVHARERREAESARRLLPGPAPEEDRRAWVCCTACEDTGWREYWCSGVPSQAPRPVPFLDAALTPQVCGRKTHAAHVYVEPCVCRDTNPVIAKQRQAARERAESRQSRRRA